MIKAFERDFKDAVTAKQIQRRTQISISGFGLGRDKDKAEQYAADYDDAMLDVIRDVEERYHARDRQRRSIGQIRTHVERFLKPKARAKELHFRQSRLVRNKTLVGNFQYGLANMQLLPLSDLQSLSMM